MKTIDKIKRFLQSEKSSSLQKFNAKLIPNIDKESILGVKIPALRAFAKDLFKDADYDDFLNDLPHATLEENHLHAFIIEQVKNFEKCIELTQKFLPYIDNWAVCDCFKPEVFKNNKKALLPIVKEWLKSHNPWVVRYAVNMLMTHYLDDFFDVELACLVAKLSFDDYYVKMVVAWYFATALAKQYDSVLAILENKKLPTWTHNKTIQKAVESYRIPNERKAYLKTLKIKEKK